MTNITYNRNLILYNYSCMSNFPTVNRRDVMIEITDSARDKLQDVLNKKDGKSLRIFLEGIG